MCEHILFCSTEADAFTLKDTPCKDNNYLNLLLIYYNTITWCQRQKQTQNDIDILRYKQIWYSLWFLCCLLSCDCFMFSDYNVKEPVIDRPWSTIIGTTRRDRQSSQLCLGSDITFKWSCNSRELRIAYEKVSWGLNVSPL